MRKIIVLKPREWLAESFHAASMNIAMNNLQSSLNSGMAIIDELPPIRVPLMGAGIRAMSRDERGFYSGPFGNNYVIAANFENEEAEQDFQRSNPDLVEAIVSDPEIAPFAPVCPSGGVGTAVDAVSKINLANLHGQGAKGAGVKVAIVDTGIDQSIVNIAGGTNTMPQAPGSVSVGSLPPNAGGRHGTMVAWNVFNIAPQAGIYDYPLLSSHGLGQGWIAYISDAIRVFAELMTFKLQLPGPLVVVNSWGMYSRSSDRPLGSPQNYGGNPIHPFNQITGALVGSGIDVVFAAGNCGSTCPSMRCGVNDRGPGNSILGANSHPDVITTAAVTVNDDLLGYSSEGPGTLAAQKPDVAGFSHFKGSGVYAADEGTSTACPVVGGVIALLRSVSRVQPLAPALLKTHLLNSARSVHGTGWSPQYGWGIVDADKTLASIP